MHWKTVLFVSRLIFTYLEPRLVTKCVKYECMSKEWTLVLLLHCWSGIIPICRDWLTRSVQICIFTGTSPHEKVRRTYFSGLFHLMIPRKALHFVTLFVQCWSHRSNARWHNNPLCFLFCHQLNSVQIIDLTEFELLRSSVFYENLPKKNIYPIDRYFSLVIPRRIELRLPGWEPGVLTVRRRDHDVFVYYDNAFTLQITRLPGVYSPIGALDDGTITRITLSNNTSNV